jgi:hypothetical protein
LREESRLRVLEKRVLRRLFGPKRDEVSGEWRKLRNEELNNLYCSLNIVSGDQFKKNAMGGARSTHGGEKSCIQALVGKPEGKRPL